MEYKVDTTESLGIFENVYCTGLYHYDEGRVQQYQKQSKSDVRGPLLILPEFKFVTHGGSDRFVLKKVCNKIGAFILIDDSVENALECARASPPVKVLLFGDYQWNKRESRLDHVKDEYSYEERSRHEGSYDNWWKKDSDDMHIPESLPIRRVKDWKEVKRRLTQI